MKLNFEKGGGLVTAVVQDARTRRVLMVGYMDDEAVSRTESSGFVTFFSRSRGRLWMKGETSGNRLRLVEMKPDCDGDALLVRAMPEGPVCHTGADTCFDETNAPDFLAQLEDVIRLRRNNPTDTSYTASLFAQGMPQIARKVGEEATETIIEGLAGNDDRLLEESADLVFHLLVMLAQRNRSLDDVVEVLERRHTKSRGD